MEKPWIASKLRQFMIGSFFPDDDVDYWTPEIMSKIDPVAIARTLKQAKAQVFYIYARGVYGNAFNNTQVWHKHTSLGDRDLVAELVEACRAEEIIPACCYEPFFGGRISREHPDWAQISAQGNSLATGDLPASCMSSPFRQLTLDHMREVVTNYDIEGFFIDMVGYIPCYCENCQEEFREEFGTEIPREPDWEDDLWKQHILWRYRQTDEFLRDVRDVVKAAKPNIPFNHNFYGGPRFSWRSMQSVESSRFNDCVFLDIFPQRDGTLVLSRIPRFFKSISAGKPQILIESVATPPRWMAKPAVFHFAEAASCLANGCSFMGGDYYRPDGTMNQPVYDMVREVFTQIEEREEWLLDSEPVPFAGLVYSERTRDFHGQEKPERYIIGYDGALQALVEAHFPLDLLVGRHLNPADLARYRAVFLSNCVCLSDKQIAAIRQYVENGGGLVASAETSLADEMGNRRPDFGLADVFGLRYNGLTEEKFSYLQVAEKHPATAEGYMTDPVILPGPQAKVEPTEPGEVLARVVKPGAQWWFGHTAPESPTEFPALFARQFGKGRVVYFASDIGAAYGQYQYGIARNLIGGAIRWAAAQEPPAEVEAPPSVEMTLYRQPDKNRLIVHLVNFQSVIGRSISRREGYEHNPSPIFDQVIPVRDLQVTIRLPKAPKALYLAPDLAKPKFRQEGDRLIVNVDRVDIHRMVVVEDG